jgi:hypothetical protein
MLVQKQYYLMDVERDYPYIGENNMLNDFNKF